MNKPVVSAFKAFRVQQLEVWKVLLSRIDSLEARVKKLEASECVKQ